MTHHDQQYAQALCDLRKVRRERHADRLIKLVRKARLGMILAVLLVLVLTGCTTLGRCERLAIAEEQFHFERGNSVFRVHYDFVWISPTGTDLSRASRAKWAAHAINYLLYDDGSRDYYDVGLGEAVKEPAANMIWYDSYDVRAVDGEMRPPAEAPRRNGG